MFTRLTNLRKRALATRMKERTREERLVSEEKKKHKKINNTITTKQVDLSPREYKMAINLKHQDMNQLS